MVTEGGASSTRRGLQERKQRQSRCQRLPKTGLGFYPKGERQESNTSKEETDYCVMSGYFVIFLATVFSVEYILFVLHYNLFDFFFLDIKFDKFIKKLIASKLISN